MDTVDDVKKEKDHDYICKLISEHFSQKLFDKVNEFFMKKPLDEINKEEIVDSNDEDEDIGQDSE